MYRPERDGAKNPMKLGMARPTMPMRPMDKMYRPERDGAKNPMMPSMAKPKTPKMNALRRMRGMK
jgi:hypothetical protein